MKHVALAAYILALAGCAPAAGIGGAAALGALAPVIAASAGISPATLSEVAKAGCAAQAAANVAADIAQQSGSSTWARHFSQASQLAGFACAW